MRNGTSTPSPFIYELMKYELLMDNYLEITKFWPVKLSLTITELKYEKIIQPPLPSLYLLMEYILIKNSIS